jgi:membrane-bound ClpP family serine protease
MNTLLKRTSKKSKIGFKVISYFLLFFIILTLIQNTSIMGIASAQNDSVEDSDEGFFQKDYTMGLILIFIGVMILLAEPFVPGLFLAIPGTVMVTIGAVGVISPDLMFSPVSLGIGLTAGVIALLVAIKVYKTLAPNRPPTTTAADSLIGKDGIITVETDPDHKTKGKVRIGSQVWSATSDTVIPVDTKVEVISSEGVHVKVKRIPNRPLTKPQKK